MLPKYFWSAASSKKSWVRYCHRWKMEWYLWIKILTSSESLRNMSNINAVIIWTRHCKKFVPCRGKPVKFFVYKPHGTSKHDVSCNSCRKKAQTALAWISQTYKIGELNLIINERSNDAYWYKYSPMRSILSRTKLHCVSFSISHPYIFTGIRYTELKIPTPASLRPIRKKRMKIVAVKPQLSTSSSSVYWKFLHIHSICP